MTETDKTLNQVIVPIVGRPNVGKSTLFNRLIGEQQAITGEKPGVTRDRLTTTKKWDGKEITFVDTAGFQQEHPAPSPEFIVRQVEAMIEEGEYILFVVDGREGILPLDREIAVKLQPVADRVLVVVNKIDPGLSPEQACADFYELGFREVIPVSARQNRNIGALKEKIITSVPEVDYELSEEGINLSLVGRPNVGKSTLFNHILGYDRVMVSDQPGTTRDIVDISFEVDDQRFQLVDTVGLRRESKVEEEVEQAGVYRSIRSINFSDISCLMLDWKERVTKQDQRIAGLIADRYRGCLILVNKADEPDETGEKSWRHHIADRLHFLKYAPVLFTSGLTGRGVADIFSAARVIHEEINTWFTREELHNSFLELKGGISWSSSQARGVILQKIEQVDVNPLTFRIKARDPQLLTPPDLRHLRQVLREKLGVYLSPIKIEFSEESEKE